MSELIKSLVEALDTKMEVQWKPHGSGIEFGSFAYKNETYVITIEVKKILKFKEKFAEIAFYNYDEKNDKAVYGSLKKFSGGDALKIMAIVMNSVAEKFNEYDGFIFTAKKMYGPDDYDSRVSLYGSIARHISKKFSRHAFIEESSDKNKTFFIISKDKLTDEITNFIMMH